MSAVLGPLPLARTVEVEAGHPLLSCQARPRGAEMTIPNNKGGANRIPERAAGDPCAGGPYPRGRGTWTRAPGGDRQGRAGPDGRASPEMKPWSHHGD